MNKKLVIAALIVLTIGLMRFVFFYESNHQAVPVVSKLVMPAAAETNPLKPGDVPVSLLFNSDNTVFTYENNDLRSGQLFDYKTVRAFLARRMSESDSGKIVVLIKPAQKATYQNTVDILDEMTVNKVKRYVMLESTPAEESFIASLKH